MTVDDWPILCQHQQCRGTATPAVWMHHYSKEIIGYYCQHHHQQLYNQGINDPDKWVQLTPNQRPSPVQEVQSGSHDQG